MKHILHSALILLLAAAMVAAFSPVSSATSRSHSAHRHRSDAISSQHRERAHHHEVSSDTDTPRSRRHKEDADESKPRHHSDREARQANRDEDTDTNRPSRADRLRDKRRHAARLHEERLAEIAANNKPERAHNRREAKREALRQAREAALEQKADSHKTRVKHLTRRQTREHEAHLARLAAKEHVEHLAKLAEKVHVKHLARLAAREHKARLSRQPSGHVARLLAQHNARLAKMQALHNARQAKIQARYAAHLRRLAAIQARHQDRLARLQAAHHQEEALSPASSIHEWNDYEDGIPVKIIMVDLNDSHVKVCALLANDGIGSSERFSHMIARSHPDVAVTGTFFSLDNLRPVGDIVINGNLAYFGGMGTALCITPSNKANMITVPWGHHHDWNGYDCVVSCGPRLLQNGQIVLDPHAERFKDRHMLAPNSRIGVGITRDNKLVFVMTHKPIYLGRLAKVMRSIGCQQAMNLDAGTSTGFYCGGHLLAVPGRRLTNAIIVYANYHTVERTAGAASHAVVAKADAPA